DDRDKPNVWNEPVPSRRIWGLQRWVSMAAAVIVCVAGFWILYHKQRVPETTNAGAKIAKRTAAQDLVAGDNEVVLTGNDDSNVEMTTKPKGTTIRWTAGNYAEKTGSDQLALYGWDQQADGDGGVKPSSDGGVREWSDGKVRKSSDGGVREWSDGGRLQSDTVWKAIAVGKNCSPFFVRLPDGSNVWLAGGTRLWYPVGNGKDPATYIVDGKAFFDVRKDESRIFTVRT